MSVTVARHTLHNFVTIALNAITSVVLTAAIARCLEPSGMGGYSLVIWLLAIAGIFVNLGTVTTTMKFMAESVGKNDLLETGAVLAEGLRQVAWNGVLVLVAWLVAAPYMANAYGGHGIMAVLPYAALAILPVASMALLSAAAQGLQRYEQVVKSTFVWTLSSIGATGMALGLGAGLKGLMLSQAVAASLACIAYFDFFARWQPGFWRQRMVPERRGALKRYARALMVVIVLDAVVWQRSGVFFLGMWAPAAEVAYYAMAFALAQMAMRMIPGTLVGLLIPSMSRSFGAGELDKVAGIYQAAGRWMAVLAVPVAVGGALLAPAVIQVLYGASYAPMATPLAILLAVGSVVMMFGFPASSVLYAADYERGLMWTGVGGSVINVALAFALIPGHGAVGAAWTTALAQLIALIPGIVLASRALGGVWPDMSRLPAVLASAALMGIPVALIAQAMPAWAALVVGIPVGAVSYTFGLWAFRALPEDDRARIAGVASRLPGVGRLVPAAT